MKKNRPVRSLRTKMILWILLFLVPILLILCVSMRGILNAYSKQMKENYEGLLRQFTADMDSDLAAAKRMLYSEELSLNFMDTKPGSSLLFLEELERLGDHLTDKLTAQERLDAYFIYGSGRMLFVQNYNTSYVENKRLADVLEKEIEKSPEGAFVPKGDYQVKKSGENRYFCLAVDMDGGIFGCWFRLERLLENVKKAPPPGLVDVYFSTAEGRALTASAKKLPSLPSGLVISQELSEAPFSLTALWDRDVIYKALYRTEGLIYGVTVLAFLLLLAYLLFLRRELFHPMHRLTENIDRLGIEGEKSLIRGKRESEEFQRVYDALIAMNGEIRTLKINVYEKEIQQQKTQLELYKLQIRPHFFMNVLNNIQCLSRDGSYGKLDEMLAMLSRHCRYVLYSSQTVLLDEELNFIKNYIELLGTQHNRQYLLEIQCPEELLDLEIPILAIQILVENAVKHATGEESILKIQIQAAEKTGEQGSYLEITVADNGAGLPGEILEKLQNAVSLHRPGEGHGIGIDNIRRRLRLLYGERGGLAFANRPKGGARATFWIPKDGEGEEDETRDF